MKLTQPKLEQEKLKILNFLRERGTPQRLDAISGHCQDLVENTLKYVDILIEEGRVENVPLSSKSARMPVYALKEKDLKKPSSKRK